MGHGLTVPTILTLQIGKIETRCSGPWNQSVAEAGLELKTSEIPAPSCHSHYLESDHFHAQDSGIKADGVLNALHSQHQMIQLLDKTWKGSLTLLLPGHHLKARNWRLKLSGKKVSEMQGQFLGRFLVGLARDMELIQWKQKPKFGLLLACGWHMCRKICSP